MKKIILFFVAVLFAVLTQAQISLDYYLPNNVSYNQSIPTPESIAGFQVGEWMVSHDKLVEYMKTISSVSDRVIFKEYARSHENRPLIQLIFTSPKNQRNLEQIKAEHKKLSYPEISKDINVDDMPVVILLGNTVHGNEPSGANSAMLTAYYLAAAEGAEIDKLLENAVIILDPALNPDGFNRHASWVNANKSKADLSDANSRIYNETWPGGRTNHYWFDLNRDYLLLAHPESRGRVERLHEWLPNVVTDHHEMGANSTFFFQPGVPSRNNPLTPTKNYELTKKIGSYHASYLDNIKTLYFSEEVFDDFYFGKGSSYPDINGGIGILFEQTSLRGFKRAGNNGVIDFPYTIKNQFTVVQSTIEAALLNKNELLNHQKEFYNIALKEADKDEVKAYVFGESTDKRKTSEFLDLLKRHQIEVHQLKEDYVDGTNHFGKDNSYIVVCKQKNYLLLKSLFEKARYFKDVTFYDVSTWNFPMSFNIPFAEIKNDKTVKQIAGVGLDEVEFYEGKVTGSDDPVAWVFAWDEYYAPRAVSELLDNGLVVKVAKRPFKYRAESVRVDFDYGSIQIPVEHQKMSLEEIKAMLSKIAKRDGLDIYGLKTSWVDAGIDIGSSDFVVLQKPEILLLVEGGTNSSDAGEIWHLFDTRYATPITLLPTSRLSSIDLNAYNTLILPGGTYNDIHESQVSKIRTWVADGGNFIAYKNATQWVNKVMKLEQEFKENVKLTDEWPKYDKKSSDANSQAINGAIFEVEMDLSHPLAFGYKREILSVFKTGTMVAELTKDPYNSPFRYTKDPLKSGFCSDENHERIKGAAFISTHKIGTGIVISIMDNTNFRGIWYGTNKVFANAVFFGNII